MAFREVRAAKVVKQYGRHRALGGVDLVLRAGRLTALLGPNGAGKSTLLGILSTLVRPTSGQVQFGTSDRPLEGQTVRAQIGVLAHEPMLYGELNAVENLALYGALYGLAEPRKAAVAQLDAVGLEPQARLRPSRTYSRGMLQRLALARSLLHQPRLLLLDEPFTGLDRAGTEAVVQALAGARRDERIVLVVTHDLEAISGLCDHLVVLRRGQIVHEELADAPFSTADLKARYIQVAG